MKAKIFNTIEIPQGVEISLDNTKVIVKGSKGTLERTFDFGKIELKVEGNNAIIGYEKSTRKEKKMIHTISAHIKNMIKGVEEGFEYTLKICPSHFPFTVNIQGDKAIIKNFLGEKVDRICKIPKGADVALNGQIITITSMNKEVAGQAAANFEAATKIKGRDTRIFQDGVYIIKKAGREV